MNLDTVSRAVPPQPAPSGKQRVLLVSDSPERLRLLSASLSSNEIEIVGVCSVSALRDECRSGHTLAVVDVAPAVLPQVLKLIRTSVGHGEIPILVEASGLNRAEDAGVLPHYRAMPCSPAELLVLARRHFAHTPAPRNGSGLL